MEVDFFTMQADMELEGMVEEGAVESQSTFPNSLQREQECKEAVDMSLQDKGINDHGFSASKVSPKPCEKDRNMYEQTVYVKEERVIPEPIDSHYNESSDTNSSDSAGSHSPDNINRQSPVCTSTGSQSPGNTNRQSPVCSIGRRSPDNINRHSPVCSSTGNQSPDAINRQSPVCSIGRSPEPMDLSLHDRSPCQEGMLEQTMSVSSEELTFESAELALRNRYATFRKVLELTLRAQYMKDQSQAIPQPIDMSFCKRYNDFRKVLSDSAEIKQEREDEDVDDMFCVDGITNSPEVERKIKLEAMLNSKHLNFLSLPAELQDDPNDGDDSKHFKCSSCSKKFLTKSRLTKHLLTHSEECYRCSFCDFNTKRKDYLRVHELNHLETKMFKCLKCNFGTNVRSRLKVHESIHAEEKSFKCFKCSYKTTRKDNLKLHELNHLNIKRFKCDHCDYGSNNKRNLKEHLLNHLELRLFKCDHEHCSYETNKKGNLRLHQVKHGRRVINIK